MCTLGLSHIQIMHSFYAIIMDINNFISKNMYYRFFCQKSFVLTSVLNSTLQVIRFLINILILFVYTLLNTYNLNSTKSIIYTEYLVQLFL